MRGKGVVLVLAALSIFMFAFRAWCEGPAATQKASVPTTAAKNEAGKIVAQRHKSYIIPSAGAGADFTSALKSDTSYQILVHPVGPEQDWTSVRIGMLNYGGAYTVKAMNLAIWGGVNKPNALGTQFGGGKNEFVPVVAKATPIKRGTDDSPTVTWLGSWPAASSKDKRALRIQIELAKGSPIVSWSGAAPGPKFLGLGWILTGDEGLEQNLTAGFSTKGHNTFGQLPLLVVEFSGFAKPVVPLLCIGDSTLWGYGDGDQYSNPYGVPGRLAERWKAAGIYVAPVNFGRTGHPTDKMALRVKAILAECDFGACLMQFGSINNVVRKYPNDQMQTDWLTAEKILQDKKMAIIPWLSPGMNAADNQWWPGYLAQQEWMMKRNPNTVAGYRKRLTDMTNGRYHKDMNFSDGAHPSALGYDYWEEDSYQAIQEGLVKQGVPLK